MKCRTFIVDIGPPFQWKPGRFRSRVTTRYWWGWFAIGLLHVSHDEYARTSYDWIDVP